MPFTRERTKEALAQLAGRGVFVGTSSWKYPGWRGTLYDEQRYVWRGRFSETRFNDHCLTEYAEVFKTVCVDAAYYKFPDQRYLEKLAAAVPEGFLFAFKVTDEITLRTFTRLPRFGVRAGKPNEHFLDAGLFSSRFLNPCEPIRKSVGLLIFEFSKFHQADYGHGREFVADLDTFFGNIPKGWPYGVEIRNRHFLKPEYFAVLRRHNVAHVYNSWTDMPPVNDQMSLDGSRPRPDLVAARFLLKAGRSYEEGVRMFQPYEKTVEANPEARASGAALIQEGASPGSEKKMFIYVNNRLEGNALETIAAMLEPANTRG